MNLCFIFLFFISIQADSIIENIFSNECKTQDIHYLDAIYSEYLSLYRKYEDKIFRNQINLFQSNVSKDNDLIENNSYFVENTQCNFMEKNRYINMLETV